MSLLSELKMWTKYKVTLEFLTPCIGGTPNAKNMIKGWLGTKNLVTSEAELDALVNATAAELGDKVEEKASAMWTVFKTTGSGGQSAGDYIYLEGRQVKAMFKESANILRDMLQKAEGKGSKKVKGEERSRFTNLKSKVSERLFVVEEKIPLHRIMAEDAGPAMRLLSEADGSDERPIHVQTAMGPRTALKRTDYVKAGTRVTFTVKALNDSVVDKELIEVLLEHSADNGLGADRSQGFGKFSVVEVTPL